MIGPSVVGVAQVVPEAHLPGSLRKFVCDGKIFKTT